MTEAGLVFIMVLVSFVIGIFVGAAIERKQ
jgi:hypothetical protein